MSPGTPPAKRVNDTLPNTHQRAEFASTKSRGASPTFEVGTACLSGTGTTDYFLWLLGWRQRFQINGPSMRPTLLHGEEVLVHPRAYRSTLPQLGDIVLVQHPFEKRRMVKRVTQWVSKNNEVRLHVEGDNKSESTDSRSFGSVSPARILGKVTSRLP